MMHVSMMNGGCENVTAPLEPGGGAPLYKYPSAASLNQSARSEDTNPDMKRSSCDYNAALKRARGPLIGGGRLCDLPSAADLFCDVGNAESAKEKGFLRGRAAKDKYEEVCAASL